MSPPDRAPPGPHNMTIDRDRLVRIFDRLGEKLATPATICVIGSSPAIIMGQPDRQLLYRRQRLCGDLSSGDRVERR